MKEVPEPFKTLTLKKLLMIISSSKCMNLILYKTTKLANIRGDYLRIG